MSPEDESIPDSLDASYDPTSGEFMIAISGQVPTLTDDGLLLTARRFTLFVHGDEVAIEFTFSEEGTFLRLVPLDDRPIRLGLRPDGVHTYRLTLEP